MDWKSDIAPTAEDVRERINPGNGLMRSLEVAAKKAGVETLLEHRMTRISRRLSLSARHELVASGWSQT